MQSKYQDAVQLLNLPASSNLNPKNLLEGKLGKVRADKHILVLGFTGSESRGDAKLTPEDVSWSIIAIRKDMMQLTTNELDGKTFGRIEATGEAYLIADGHIYGPNKARQGLYTGFWIFLLK